MDLKPLFEPKTMAVIGISATNDRHPANVIYAKNKNRYPVEVYGVNPKGGTWHGETIYAGVADIPEKIDLAVIATRAELVPQVLTDCVRAGVKSAAIISGGFAEGGRPDLQERIVGIAREADLPFIGPTAWAYMSPLRSILFFCRSSV